MTTHAHRAHDRHEPEYRCNHCGQIVRRDSDKRWIKSYCDTAGKTTRLWKVTR